MQPAAFAAAARGTHDRIGDCHQVAQLDEVIRHAVVAVVLVDLLTQQVESALRAQVDRIAREGVQEAELQRVKTQWIASEVYKLDSVFSQARELGAFWAIGFEPDAGERIMRRLREVTPAQVQSVAARYFSDDQLTAGVLHPLPLDPQRKPRTPPAGVRH